MIPKTLDIQSYRRLPASRTELHAISIHSGENATAAVISMAEKTEQPVIPQEKAGPKGWVMPPIVYAYLKGRDNDPL